VTAEIGVVYGLIVVALVLFAWERVPFDVTALIVLSVLLGSGIITPEEGFAGFGNRAVVAIAAMFVLTAGLERTGFLEILGELLMQGGRGRFWPTLLLLMGGVGVVSAFMNNTAAVAIFIPVVLRVSARMEVSPSLLLIPLSFASMFGGVTTLIGTSTNLLVSSIAQDAGVGAFTMFDFTPAGLVFFGTGFAYVATVGVRLIPERRSPRDLTASFDVGGYITDVEVGEDSELLGRSAQGGRVGEGLDVDVLEVLRRADRGGAPRGHAADPEDVSDSDDAPDPDASADRDDAPLGRSGDERGRARGREAVLEPGDVLRVRGGVEAIEKLLDRPDLSNLPSREWTDSDLELGSGELVEAVVAPDSDMVGRTVAQVDVARRFGAVPLAVRQQGEVERDDLGGFELSGGDSLLLLMDPGRVGEVEDDPSFVVVSGLARRHRRDRLWVALLILSAVVSLAALGVAPIAVTATLGAVALILSGCLDKAEAYEAINWKVIFLLAGILPLGTAMETTGAAGLLADGLLSLLEDAGPRVVLAGLLATTMLLTEVVTNNATAVLLAPVAISAAETLGVDPWPLLMGVTYAASLSFATPVGYQTNTLIYGPGGYRFSDYLKVGGPLNLLFIAIGTLVIPLVFPF
jgi:di/tricarboxylate transporter